MPRRYYVPMPMGKIKTINLLKGDLDKIVWHIGNKKYSTPMRPDEDQEWTKAEDGISKRDSNYYIELPDGSQYKITEQIDCKKIVDGYATITNCIVSKVVITPELITERKKITKAQEEKRRKWFLESIGIR